MKLKPIASNQTELTTTEGAVILFSYETPVAALLPSGQYARTSDWYSQTTSRHINKWLQGVTADVLEKPEEWFRSLVQTRPEAPATNPEAAINAIKGKLAVVENRLEQALANDRPAFHLQQIRGAIEGLEMALEAMPTAHLVPKVEAPSSEEDDSERATHSYGWDCGEWEARAGGAP